MTVWFCTECGARHDFGKFCGECGAPKYGTAEVKDAPLAGRTFSIGRSSVCAGDDCRAPHLSTLDAVPGDTVMDLLAKVADYVPFMSNASWNVLCGFDTIGCLIAGEDGPYRCIAVSGVKMAVNLPADDLFCHYIATNSVKDVSDFKTSGVLAYGVNVGKVDFEVEGVMVYAVSDLPHISASDCFTIYQISRADYERLMRLACPNRIPDQPISAAVTDACRQRFLCGESIYQMRNRFTLADVDLDLCELY